MALVAGTKLGPYEILSPIGKGGMGEVYKARDTRLDREVAVKVSSERFSDRFEREAHAIAALNHPNICTLHDVGPDYLVMELAEGPTLAERIGEGAIPLEEALGIARQIADALEAAHEKGITHRDLKPGNIKIKPDGTVKVLDFGLAKMAEPVSAPGSDPEHSPTLTLEAATRVGAIMGTAGYMAPEQARGKKVDKRADIWAFGVVLYEMLTGRRLFRGEDLTETLASVVKEQPDLSAAPPKVRRLLEKCLVKDPKKRLRDIGDAWELLEERPEAKPGQGSWLQWALIGACVALAAALAVVSLLWLRTSTPEVRSVQFEVNPPGDTRFSQQWAATAISPDGRYVVFGARTGAAASLLWLRPLDSVSARPLQGTERGNVPFWSPDGKSVAFFADGKLKRKDIVGGAPQVLCDAAAPLCAGGTWSRDGVILFGSSEGLFRVPASGGVPQQVTQPDPARKEAEHGVPQFLPDGKRFLYFIRSADPNTQGIYAGSLDNPKERVRVLATEHKAYYVPALDGRTGSGFLVWLREQTLLAQPFDPAKLTLEGDATPLAEDVAVAPAFRTAFWTSDAGPLVYRKGDAGAKRNLIWISRDGKRLGEAGKQDRYRSIRLSPEGKRVAIGRDDEAGIADIWMLEFGRGEVMPRLTFDPGRDRYPVWSPDGRQIVYSSDRSRVWQIYRKDTGGGGQEEQLTSDPNQKYVTDWSRDGRYLLYHQSDPKTSFDLWVLALDGERKPVAVLQTPFSERFAQFSPDGKWIAYQSDESGRDEVYVRAFPGSGGQRQVSNQGGAKPKWRADGKELFYLGPNSNLLAAGIRVAGASFQSDTPRELFPIPSTTPWDYWPYDVTADGQRFLVLQPGATGQGPDPLTVVTNWQARLKK
ncbi:MAG: protein kinase [Planctomycetota bacterium]